MSEQPRVNPADSLAAGAVRAADATDAATFREVFRAKHRLTVSVMERPRDYRVAYSLGDIHRLTFLSAEERGAVRREWDAWHRQHARLRGITLALWMTGAVGAWWLWFRAAATAGTIHALSGLAVPDTWLAVLAVIVAVGLLIALPAVLATLSAPALADSYLQGYSDGLSRGVSRALQIAPDDEREMWDELREAERLDAAWRRMTGPPVPE